MNVKKIALTLAGLGVLAFGATACSQPASQTAAPESTTAKTPMSAMPTATTAATSGPVQATGIVSAIDATAGTITINHGPITAISWPAMNMQFHAENSAILHGIAAGDHVAFELKSAADTGTVIMVQKQ